MGSKKKKAREGLTPGGEFGAICEQFPNACKGEKPCRNIIGIGAGIVLAYEKASRGVMSHPEYAEANGLAELDMLSRLAQWSQCPGPGENHTCPTGEYMGQVVGVAHFGSDFNLEKGSFKRAQDETGSSAEGTYL